MLLRNLDLKQKIAQMLIVGFDGCAVNKEHVIAKAIKEEHLGGVILFDKNLQHPLQKKNIQSPAQLKQLTSDLMSFVPNPNLPLFISVDYEGGQVNRLKSDYGFPETESAATIARLGLDHAKYCAREMAHTLKASGINLNFAPLVDVNVNLQNPIIGQLERSFSEDPNEVIAFANVFSETFAEYGILATYKHFPGHGSSDKDSHLGFVDVSDSWQSYELAPYASLKNCHFVMTAHIINRQLDPSGLPATLSKPILIDLLRHTLKYPGIIVTDDMQMKAISDHYGIAEASCRAINAGADMLIYGNQLSAEPVMPKQLIEMIAELVASGQIEKSRIDDAFQRIQNVKQQMRVDHW